MVTRGDSRIAVTLPRNEYTRALGRENRFLIDDFSGSGDMLSFTLSKPLKVGHTYDDINGIYKFVLHEVNSTKDDNFDLGIADYYKFFPREDEHCVCDDSSEESAEENVHEETGKKRWL